MKNSKVFSTTALVWLPLAAVTTILTLLIYAVVQQNYRMNANDPQIQLAEDAAATLARGQDAQALVAGTPVDIASSLAPFMVVYNKDGQPIASSGLLRGSMPTPPSGVLTFAAAHSEDRVTWEPNGRGGVRVAAIVTAVNAGKGGYVLAGRSLKEVEKRVDDLGGMTFAAWVAAMVVSLMFVFAFAYLKRNE